MFDLTGKVAVVTGAGSGIGRGISLALARVGADVLVSDIDLLSAERTAGEIESLGRRSLAVLADVRDKQAVDAMVDSAVRDLGRLDIAVANAGTMPSSSLLTLSEDEWDLIQDVNLKGTFLTGQAAARALVRQNQGGRLILIASLTAERPNPKLFAYAAAKAGVRMLARCWALELAPFEITVNSIGPGLIDTALTAGMIGEGADREMAHALVPAGRLGTPEDVGNLTCWLASDEAQYVTGGYHIVDGGRSNRGYMPAEDEYYRSARELRRRLNGDDLLDALTRS